MLLSGVSYSYAQHHSISHNKYKDINNFQYYIFIAGITQRENVIALENSVQKKPGVTYFMADRYPVRCFILKSNKPVTIKEFATWIDNPAYQVQVFGSDEISKEKAYTLYIKNKKNSH